MGTVVTDFAEYIISRRDRNIVVIEASGIAYAISFKGAKVNKSMTDKAIAKKMEERFPDKACVV